MKRTEQERQVILVSMMIVVVVARGGRRQEVPPGSDFEHYNKLSSISLWPQNSSSLRQRQRPLFVTPLTVSDIINTPNVEKIYMNSPLSCIGE